MSKRSIKVKIIYKTGTQITFRCKEFTATRNNLGELTAVKWDDAWPNPLYFNVDSVESIWVVKR